MILDIDPQVKIFLIGSLGSVFPEILRLYRIYVDATGRGRHHLPKFHRGYFVITVILMAAAGTLAVVWEPENNFKALWVGATTPLIVSAISNSQPKLIGAGEK